jgi:integrase
MPAHAKLTRRRERRLLNRARPSRLGRNDGEIEPKSDNGERKIPVAAVLRDHLDQHLLDTDSDRVFVSPWWIIKAASRARPIWQAAGLPAITLHTARHTFASVAIAAWMNAKTLCTIMGHANIATTFDEYGHLLPGSEDEAAARLGAFSPRLRRILRRTLKT